MHTCHGQYMYVIIDYYLYIGAFMMRQTVVVAAWTEMASFLGV